MIIDILLPLSVIFIMFSLGIGLSINDFRNVRSQPEAFFVGILIQMIGIHLLKTYHDSGLLPWWGIKYYYKVIKWKYS